VPPSMYQVATDIHHFGFFSVGAASRPSGTLAKGALHIQGDQNKQSVVLDWDILKRKFSMRAGPEVRTAFMRLERSRRSA
jgi:hypothetical protein